MERWSRRYVGATKRFVRSPSRHPNLCNRLPRQRLRAGKTSVSNLLSGRRTCATTGDCGPQNSP